MSSFVKTCVSQVLLLVALAVPVFGAGCERQSDPPIEPRSATPAAAPQARIAAGGAPDAAPEQVAEARGRASPEDAALTARVKTALMADEQVKGLAIDVDTRDATVTLTGTLDHQTQVARAVEVARSVEGVREVVNRLGVRGEDKAATTNQG
jgi:hyperosmotically inducible periplasmic protein